MSKLALSSIDFFLILKSNLFWHLGVGPPSLVSYTTNNSLSKGLAEVLSVYLIAFSLICLVEDSVFLILMDRSGEPSS